MSEPGKLHWPLEAMGSEATVGEKDSDDTATTVETMKKGV